jgi:lysophospholipase L1-like esterase
VQQQTTAESPVVIADCSRAAGFTNAMLDDGVHPNSQGDEFIAGQIGPKLIELINDVRGGTK